MKWDKVSVETLTKIVTKGTTPTSIGYQFVDNGIPFLRVNNIQGGGLDISDVLFINNETDAALKRSRILPNDVLISIAGTIGRSAVVSENAPSMNCNQAIAIIRLQESANPYYFRYWLNSQEAVNQISDSKVTATISNLSLGCINKLKISLPPLEEQKRIAAILDKADRVRRKRQEAIQLTEELGRSIFLDMFGDPISQGWKMVKVGDMAAKSKNSMRTGPFGSNLLHSEFVDEGISVLGIDNAVQNKFVWAKSRFITLEKYQQLKNYTVYPEDVIITIMGTCGRCAIIPPDCPIAINTKHLCCITTNKEICLPEFLYGYFLFHPIAKQYFERNTKGAIMDGLNQTIIKGLPIPIAPIDLQCQYKKAIHKLNILEVKANNYSDDSENLFNSLLQRAFRGEL